jgi:hypothetical protein
MNTPAILGLLRHALTLLGGYLAGQGALNPADSETIVGGLVALVGFVLSWRNKKESPVVVTKQDTETK